MKKKINSIVSYLMLVTAMLPTYVFAARPGEYVFLEFNSDENRLFKNPLSKAGSIPELVKTVLEFVSKVGAVVVIFAIIYSGFLFVKAQGNESEIEEAKKTFFWSVIGGLVVLAAKALAILVCNTANSLGLGASCGF